MTEPPNKFEAFPWNDNLLVGIPEIDVQHRKLVSLVNDLAAGLVEEDDVQLAQVFDALADYANYHFETEEQIWARGFGDDEWYLTHQQRHATFLQDVSALKDAEKPFSEVAEGVVGFLVRWLAFHIIDSDRHMAAVLRAMKMGATLQEAKRDADDAMTRSIDILVETVLIMNESLSHRTLELMRERDQRRQVEEHLKEANRKLEAASITDPLTGLFNRRHFDMVTQNELRRARRDERFFSFIMFDIDHFKKLNDHYGHATGDDALRKIGATLKDICRRPADYAFRMGGEEFGVIIEAQSPKAAAEFGEMIRARIAALEIPNADSDVSDTMTVSVGIVSKVPSEEDTVDKFLATADSRLYTAKNSGRNCVVAG